MVVRDWMSPNPQTVGPHEILTVAEEKMQRGGFRCLPVVDDQGKLAGIVTDRDLRRHHGYYDTTRINAAMTEQVVTIGPDESIEAAADLAVRRKIGGLPVVAAGGEIVGIITTTDLVRGLLRCLAGDATASGRIDFAFTSPKQTFADVVAAIEKQGGVILGLGTLRPADERPADTPETKVAQRPGAQAESGTARVFYIRIRASDLAPFADVMREAGCLVRAVHPGPVAG